MTKQSLKAEVNSFSQGLITEASPLNFPPNAAKEIENFELNRDGTVFRRRGMNLEPNFIYRNAMATVEELRSTPPKYFKWMQVGGDTSINFLVIQILDRINFYDMEFVPLSGGFIGEVISTPTFPNNVQYSFAAVDGRLIVAAGIDVIMIIEYAGGSTFNTSFERLKTRDVWGVEETSWPLYETDIAFRGFLSSQHIYNLQNQSWGIPRKDDTGSLVDPAFHFETKIGAFPSNSEIIWTGIQFQAVSSGQTPFERMYANLYDEVRGSSIKAAKGYYIIDVLRRGQSRVDEFVANFVRYPILRVPSVILPSDFTPGGAKYVCEFAGRVFYGGFSGQVEGGDKRSPNLSNLIFFSQLVKSRPDIIKCYQAGDPTSREDSDVVDIDGGFVRISGMEEMISMINMASHLIVIARNGVWAISGGSDFGFSATNFKVDKISSFGGMSNSSVVEDAGRAFFWGEDGIYIISKDQFGSFQVQNITETTIQTFYESISNTSKEFAVGCYDAIGKKIRWLYKEGLSFSSTSVTKELVFDISLGAFYTNKIYNNSNNNIEVITLFSGTEFRINNQEENIVVNLDIVTVGVDNVIITSEDRQSGIQSTRYLAISTQAGFPVFSFSYYRDESFRDWLDGVGVASDAFAFLLTGEQTGGDSSLSKQIPYLTMHFFRTENGVDANFIPINQSGCFVRSQWDFAVNSNSNKFSPLWQAYRYRKAYIATSVSDPFDTGFEIITSKTKLRGRGKAFSLYMETEPQKDCKIVGWNLAINANSIT